MLALLLIAALTPPPAQAPVRPAGGPWAEMSAGPQVMHLSGVPGLSGGTAVRLSVGTPLGQSWMAELWTSGNLQAAPRSMTGDAAVLAGGLGGRARLYSFDPQDRLSLWARAGFGWSLASEGVAPGPVGQLGCVLAFQPVVRRFALGLGVEAAGQRAGFGLSLLPSLRASF